MDPISILLRKYKNQAVLGRLIYLVTHCYDHESAVRL